jgi:hypothetical protein
MKFHSNKGYFLHTTQWNIPLVPPKAIDELDANHAGALSHFREIIIENIFDNLERRGNNSEYDFMDNISKNKIEAKNINKKGVVKLTPSHMSGAGRSFDKIGYDKFLNDKDCFLITIPYSHNNEIIIPITTKLIIAHGSPKKINKDFISKIVGIDNIDTIEDFFIKKVSCQERDELMIVPFNIPLAINWNVLDKRASRIV